AVSGQHRVLIGEPLVLPWRRPGAARTVALNANAGMEVAGPLQRSCGRGPWIAVAVHETSWSNIEELENRVGLIDPVAVGCVEIERGHSHGAWVEGSNGPVTDPPEREPGEYGEV